MSKRRVNRPFFTSFTESVAIAADAVRANKLRSFLTCLGIIIGVATVICMMSIVGGINNIVEEELGRIGANVFFVKRFPSVQITMDWRKFRKRPNISKEDWEAIQKRCRLISEVSPEAYQSNKILSFQGEKTNPDVYMVGATESFFRVNGYDMKEGRFFTETDIQKKRNVCILGMTVVERLFPFISPIGNKIRISGVTYTVIGVYEPLGTMFGTDRDNSVVIPISKVVNLKSRRRHGSDVSISLQAANGVAISRAMDEVRSVLRISRGLKPDEEDNFELETRDSIMRTYQSMTGSIFGAAVGIAFISLLVGGIGIMNIMLVSVRERTREIGVRKALGARGRDIMWQFLVEAMVLSVAGGILGMSLGIGGLKIVSLYTDKLPFTISSGPVIIAIVFSIMVGVFFGVYPARKAAKLDPIDSLRYE